MAPMSGEMGGSANRRVCTCQKQDAGQVRVLRPSSRSRRHQLPVGVSQAEVGVQAALRQP